jgi:hypothetical protein
MRQQKSVQNPAPPISSTLTGTKQPAHRETPTSTTTSRITYEQVEKLLNVAAVIVCAIVVGAFLVSIAHELMALWHFLATQIHGGGPVGQIPSLATTSGADWLLSVPSQSSLRVSSAHFHRVAFET